MRVAGLAPVEGIPGLENIDVTSLVNGHMAYRAAMPRLLREVGWMVESDEFSEIEDPDPENHEKRQRELIREIDEARKEAEAKPEKRRFGFFKRGKLAERKGWETYDDRMREGNNDEKTNANGGSSNVLFDIEAIKAELASEQIEVKQLESTLPPMKLNLGERPRTEHTNQSPRLSLRQNKSYDASMAFRPKVTADTSQVSLPENPTPKSLDQGLEEGNSNIRPTAPEISSNTSKSLLYSNQRSHSMDGPHPSAVPSFPTHEPSLALQGADTDLPTLPTAINHDPGLEHNAWLDEDEDDLGEKETTMSFA